MANRFINHLPHTEFGATLKLNEEQKEMCRVVYKLSEKYPDRYVFYGLWEPERDYPDEYVILPIQSTACTKVSRSQGHDFANLIKSTKDPKINNQSWIGLLRNNGINCSSCMTDGNFYNPQNDEPFAQATSADPLSCSTEIIGGHVYPGTQNVEFDKSDRKTVELIPICKHHNTYTLGDGHGCGTGFYMKLGQQMDILALHNYLNRNAIDMVNAE